MYGQEYIFNTGGFGADIVPLSDIFGLNVYKCMNVQTVHRFILLFLPANFSESDGILVESTSICVSTKAR